MYLQPVHGKISPSEKPVLKLHTMQNITILILLLTVFYTNEALFHLSVLYLYRTNIWSTNKPHAVHEILQHDQKMRIAIFRRILNPIFFSETINSDYCETFQQSMAELTENEINNVRIQQDGAAIHTARRSLKLLQEVFDNRIISKGL